MSRTADIEAEQSVLGALMQWPESFGRVADVLSEVDFANGANRAIFGVVAALIGAGRPVDVVTVHSELMRKGVTTISLPALNDIAQSITSARGVRDYAESIRAAALERRLLSAIDEAAEITRGDGEFSFRLERAAMLISGLSAGATRRVPRPAREIVGNRIDYYTALAEGKVPPAWKTQIPSLDRLLSGGLRGGKVYVIAARPKVGKTSLAMQIALTFAREDSMPTLVLTQEMPSEELTDRAVANLGRVEYSHILTGEFTEDEWGRLADGIDGFAKMSMAIDDQGGLTLTDIRTKARSVKGLKLLVIDYVQLCYGSGRRESNRSAELEEITRGIKTLAKELDCAVLLLSQLNRGVEQRADKRPMLSDLRDSGSIEQDADAIIFLWAAHQFERDGHKLIGCAVAANRSGSTGEFGLDLEGRYQRWVESSEDIRPATPARRRDDHS